MLMEVMVYLLGPPLRHFLGPTLCFSDLLLGEWIGIGSKDREQPLGILGQGTPTRMESDEGRQHRNSESAGQGFLPLVPKRQRQPWHGREEFLKGGSIGVRRGKDNFQSSVHILDPMVILNEFGQESTAWRAQKRGKVYEDRLSNELFYWNLTNVKERKGKKRIMEKEGM